MDLFLAANLILLWVFLGLNLVLSLVLVRRVTSVTQSGNSQMGGGLESGETAPDFTAKSLDGEKVTLASYAGQSVAFLFFGTACPPCREALPKYEAVAPKAALAGTRLVLVSTDDEDKTKDFVKNNDISLPVIVAPIMENNFMKDYKATGTPAYCLIDTNGKVKSAGYPSFDWGTWKALITAWETKAGMATGSNTVKVLN